MKYLKKYDRSYAPSALNDPLTFVDEILDNFWGSYNTTLELVPDDDNYIFDVELPGFSKEDVNVSIKQNNLILNAKNKKRERNKTITLPQDINAEKISANLKNGVLTITIPKKVKGSSKRIKVT